MIKIGNFLALLFFSAVALAEVRFDATVDRTQIGMDDSVHLVLTLSGDSDLGDSEPTLPDLQGFEVMGSQRQSATSSIYNNGKFQMLRQYKFIYSLMPQKQGALTIGAATVDVKGQKLSTKPITIKVGPAGQRGSSPRQQMAPDDEESMPSSPFGDDDEDAQIFNQLLRNRGFMVGPGGGIKSIPKEPDKNAFFISVEVNKKKVFVGEQIIASWYFYTKGNVSSFDPLKYPELKGFRKEDLEIAQRLNFTQEIVNGVPYNKALLVSYALFPINAGRKTIDQLKVKAGVVDLSGGMGVFGMGRSYTFTKASQEVPIEVMPLPTQGRPESFSGAVGKFSITGSLSSTTAKVNQPVSLKIRFQGKGNVRAIELPALNFPSHLEVYDTKKDSQFSKNGEGFIEFEVLLIPRSAGDVTVPAIPLSFFDPQTAKYTTQKTPEFKLKVLPGDGTNNFSSPLATAGETPAPQTTVKEYRYLKAEPVFVLDKNLSKILWLLAFVLPVLWTAITTKRLKNSVNGGAKNELKKRVQVKLKMAREKLKAGDYRSGGVELSNAMLSVLGEVSGRGGASLTADQLLELINADDKLKEKTLSFLSHCELMSFAPEEMASKNHDQKILKEAENIMELYLKGQP